MTLSGERAVALANASCAARTLADVLISARRINGYAWNPSPYIEEAWTHYHALGDALRATGVEPPQPPEGADARVP